MVGLQHLYVWIVGQAVLANRREISSFPARAIEVMLDLWLRHDEGIADCGSVQACLCLSEINTMEASKPGRYVWKYHSGLMC